MSEPDKNNLSDEALRQMLQLSMLLSKEDDKKFETLIDMEAKYALTAPAFAGIAIPAEAKLLAKLKTVSGKAIYGKWIFTAVAVTGIGTASYFGITRNSHSTSSPQQPVPKTVAAIIPPNDSQTLIAEPTPPTRLTPKKDTVIYGAYLSTPVPNVPTAPPAASGDEHLSAPQIRGSYSSGTLRFNDISLKIDTLFKGITRLEVNAMFCDINVVNGEKDLVKLNGSLNMKNKKEALNYFIRYEKIGSTLVIKVDKKEKNNSWISWNTQLNGVLNFMVDPKTDIVLKNSSGNINALGLEASSFNVDCAYGNVNVEKMNNNINIMAGSGDVHISSINGNVNCQANYGNMSILNIKGEMSIHSNSGNIAISNVEGNTNLDAKYGMVNINKLSGNLDINSSSGNISLGDINGKSIHLKCLYGNVSLKNSSGSTEIDSKSGDVSVTNHTGNTILNSVYGNQSISKINGDLKAVSKSGSVSLSEVKGNISIDAFYGSVFLRDCKGKMSIVAASGDISGQKVEVEESLYIVANYGSIRMDLANPGDQLSFDLNAPLGVSKVAIGTLTLTKQSGKLIHSGGNIRINSTTNTGNQYFE